MTQEHPKVGIPVKLRRGMLQLSARQIHHITDVQKLEVNEGQRYDPQKPYLSQADVDGEGGYWIKTDKTKGGWWAWSLFRVA
jgi:hypothetical protein